jgi:hypothetical protein
MLAEYAAPRLKIKNREGIAEVIHRIITPEEMLRVFSGLQDPAPSGSEQLTRTPVLRELLEGVNVPLDSFDVNFAGSRSPAILLATPQKLWVSAHSDTISFGVRHRTNLTSVKLMPFAAHRPVELKNFHTREFPAAVLRYDTRTRGYERISEGVIGYHDGKDMVPYYNAATKPKTGFNPGLDRFVFTPTMQYDFETGLLQGNVDNAAGLAVCILVLKTLTVLARENGIDVRDFPVGFVFPGQEEGSPDQNATFARGARQIIKNTRVEDLPQTIIEVDEQDTIGNYPVSTSALLAPFVSEGRGVILSPQDFGEFSRFLRSLSRMGVSVKSSDSAHTNVSRSNDPAYMERIPGIIPVGYGGRWPHFNDGMPQANLTGLVNNAKAIACIAAASAGM